MTRTHESSELQQFRTLHLFAGAGGGILADVLLGHVPIGAVEIDPYCLQVLHARQSDGCLPWFPLFDDIRTFDGRCYRGLADIIAGGFPCQDISCAGRGAGIRGPRSGLWSEMARIVREVGPKYVFVENVPVLLSRGIGVVLGDLAAMGYDAEWCVLGARHVGAPHQRDRVWIFAHTNRHPVRDERRRGSGACGEDQTGTADDGAARDVAHPNGDGRAPDQIDAERFRWWDVDPADLPDPDPDRINADDGRSGSGEVCRDGFSTSTLSECEHWPAESRVGRVADGMVHRVDRIRCIGNGQVPAVAALAWRTLYRSARQQ